MEPFVGLALTISEKMEMNREEEKCVMRTCKLYPPDRVAKIYNQAISFNWWRKNKKAAWFKAVGMTNKLEDYEK